MKTILCTLALLVFLLAFCAQYAPGVLLAMRMSLKRRWSLLLSLALVISMTGCGTQTAEPSFSSAPAEEKPPLILQPTDQNSSSEPTQPSESVTDEPEAKTNILIAYFTWAENTHVDDPDSVDVDATTSASVLAPGNVGLLAQWIAEETGGDRFSILTQEPYSSDYDTCLNRAIEEHDSGTHPALQSRVENMQDYDIVFLGFPNWWYSCPMAILSFIEENDLSGKTIIPFCSHGTGGFAASLRDIGNALPDDCTVLQEFGAYRPEVKQSRPALLEWLSGLDISY